MDLVEEGEKFPGFICRSDGIQAPRKTPPQSFSRWCDVHNMAGLSSGCATAQTSGAFPKKP